MTSLKSMILKTLAHDLAYMWFSEILGSPFRSLARGRDGRYMNRLNRAEQEAEAEHYRR